MNHKRSAFALLCAALAVDLYAASPDFAREDRLASEVVPQVVVGDVVWLATRERARVLALYTEAAGKPRGAVIVVHGLGVHPDWNLIGALRSELAERGFATLSIQMPVLAADAPREGYRDLFPAAAARLDAGAGWLREKGVGSIAVVSHSMGAAMVGAWFARPDAPAVEAWIAVGMLVDFDAAPRVPVLDVIAERDFPEAIAAAKRRAPRLPRDACSQSLMIPDTDHYFDRATGALVDASARFLDKVMTGACGSR